MWLSVPFFWRRTVRKWVIGYRSFEGMYWPLLQGSKYSTMILSSNFSRESDVSVTVSLCVLRWTGGRYGPLSKNSFPSDHPKLGWISSTTACGANPIWTRMEVGERIRKYGRTRKCHYPACIYEIRTHIVRQNVVLLGFFLVKTTVEVTDAQGAKRPNRKLCISDWSNTNLRQEFKNVVAQNKQRSNKRRKKMYNRIIGLWPCLLCW